MPVGKALDAGLGAIGTLLECTRAALGRLAAQVGPLAGLERRATGDARPAAEAGAPVDRAAGPQDEVEEAKYYLGPLAVHAAPAQPPGAPGELVDREEGELPRAYGVDRIVILPRDPWWLFAYWEVTPSTRIQALRTLGAQAEGAQEVLRVYDVTFITFAGDNAWRSFDVELPPGADRWYLNVGRPATTYCVEIGIRTPHGRFLALARSNTVTTSRAAPSPDATVRWVQLRRQKPPVDTPAAWSGTRLPDDVAATAASRGAVARVTGSSDLSAPRPR
jgi:hypothetical protein